MRVLGVESSYDETAASIVEDGRVVRSDVVASQDEVHARYSGVVLELASRAHVRNVVPVAARRALIAVVGAGATRASGVELAARRVSVPAAAAVAAAHELRPLAHANGESFHRAGRA